MRPPLFDESLNTDALPGGPAGVVVARHPAQARVVSAELAERRRAGNGIGHVIVAAGCEMVSRPTALVRRSSPTILALKAIIARQDDAATVQERQETGLFSALTEGNL
jgi:hypothetical protein